MASLLIFGIVQIGTAAALLIPNAPPLFGIRVPPPDMVIYLYFCASLYFALGLLYVLGAFKQEFRKAALTIACVDAVLETVSAWLGFPPMQTPYWLIALYSVVLIALGAACLVGLVKRKAR